MQHMSRWSVVLAAFCLTAACSDSVPTTAAVVPSVSAEINASSCLVELEALRTAIGTARFSGKNGETNQANLRIKVDEAQAKLAEGKAAGAIQKLEDIRTTVVAFSTPDANGKTKLDATDAAAIIEAVTVAEACINAEATPVA